MELLKEIGLPSSLDSYEKSVRLISSFCAIEPRFYWIENICCDGIGPNQNKFDYIFPGQSLFWFFLTTDETGKKTYICKRKGWGTQIWIGVNYFFA